MTGTNTATKVLVTNPFFSGSMPVPPGINKSYRIVTVWTSNGQKHRLASTVDLDLFKHDAAIMLSQAEHDYALINAIRESKRRTPLSVAIRVYFPKPVGRKKRRDTDGVVKHCIDAVFDRLELNDELVDHIQVVREYSDNPRVEMDVFCLLTGEEA